MTTEAVLTHHLEAFAAGEVTCISWHAGSDTLDVQVGTDTFLVPHGKIAEQTFAAHIVSKL